MVRVVVLHAADLDLDVPFEGIGRTPPQIANAGIQVCIALGPRGSAATRDLLLSHGHADRLVEL